MNSELHTTQLRSLIERFQRGDQTALDELLRLISRRLEHLARSMLQRFPSVRDHVEIGDVVQETSLSLITALRQLSFSSTREFYGLAARHMRQRLLDLARRYDNPIRSAAPLSTNEAEDCL